MKNLLGVFMIKGRFLAEVHSAAVPGSGSGSDSRSESHA